MGRQKYPQGRRSPYSAGFVSLDAALSFLLCAVAFSSFSSLLLSAVSISEQGARAQSAALQPLRLSSLLLSECAQSGGFAGSHAVAGTMREGCIDSLPMAKFTNALGRNFASARLLLPSEAESASFGVESEEKHCAQRLVLYKGQPARLEVCLS